jgi:hypothetical protein
MKLTETIIGRMHTMHLTDTVLGHTISATLSGIEPHRYALIDGLLWWCIGRRLELLWESFRSVQPDLATKHSHEVASALVRYVHTVPFHEVPEDRQRRIMDMIGKHVPELATLAKRVRNAQAETEVAIVRQLAETLKARIENPNDAGHGLEDVLTYQQIAA